MTDPLRVLFVCTANICRSPFMELLARDLDDGSLVVGSAGTHAADGHPMDHGMAAEATGRSLTADDFRSRRLTPALVDAADVVLTAEVSHRTFLLDEQPAAFRKAFTLGQFARAVEATPDVHGPELLAQVGARRPAADRELDVADPYRRGPEAAAVAARHVESLLRVVVPALSRSGRIAP